MYVCCVLFINLKFMVLYVKDLIIILNNIIGIGKLEFVWNKYIVGLWFSYLNKIYFYL